MTRKKADAASWAALKAAADDGRRDLLAWAEKHVDLLADLRDLERLGVSPEKAVALLLFGEEALRRAIGEGDPEEAVKTKLRKVLRRSPFAVFSARSLWRLRWLLADAGDVVIEVIKDADGRPVPGFAANVRRASRREIGSKIARRLFEEARPVRSYPWEPEKVTFPTDEARNELREALGALQKGAAALSSRVDGSAIAEAVADLLEDERSRERQTNRESGTALDADDRVAERYGLGTGGNLRKFIAARKRRKVRGS